MADADTPLLVEEGDNLQDQADAWKGVERVKLSVDLLAAARQLLQLLRQVNRHPCLYGGPAVVQAIRRYEQCWLPLAAKQEADSLQGLVPPLDVEWVWLCHRLSPVAYEEDTQQLCRKLVDGAVQDPHSFDRAAGQEACRRLWAAACPEEPFEADLSAVPPAPCSGLDEADAGSDSSAEERSSTAVVPLPEPSAPSRLTCDLAAAVRRQSDFFFQVDRPCMENAEYMKGGLQRYRLFLNLLRLHRGSFLVPTYDMDLLWHAHMMCARAYAQDTTALLGRVLDHDDTDAERGPGAKLELGFRATASLWDKAYGVPYDRAGAMYRGPAPEPAMPPPDAAARRSERGEVASDKFGGLGGLTVRLVFKAHVMVWGIYGLPYRIDQPLSVKLRALEAAADLELESPGRPYSKGWPLPSWKQRWSLECERASKGVSLELLAEPKSWLGQLWGPRVLGSAALEWARVQEQPALFLDAQLPLAGFSLFGEAKPPRLHVAVSLTPPAPGPQLLRAVFMRGTDDNGGMVCEDVFLRGGLKAQVGRWVSRTVLDHADREVFVVRKRVAAGIWEGTTRPTAVLPRERVIVVHQGGWSYLDDECYREMGSLAANPDPDPPHCRVGYARGSIIAQAVPQASPDFGSLQKFVLVGGGDQFATLTVTRDKLLARWIDSVQLTLEDENGWPARLLLGRHLDYKVAAASKTEDQGFVTLVRYPPEAPRGRATALFNWRTATMEAAAEEAPILVLLLMLAFTEALHEMEAIDRVRPYRRVRLPHPDPSRQWDAAVTGKVCLPGEAKEEFKFSSVETDSLHWWNVGTAVRGPGAGSCGAGACGPSIPDGSTAELYIHNHVQRTPGS